MAVDLVLPRWRNGGTVVTVVRVSSVRPEGRNPVSAMRMFSFIALAISLAAGSAAAAPPPASDGAAPSPVTAGTPAELFAGLEGETCRGAMVLTKVAGKDEAPVSTPIVLDWFRGTDGGTWVDFKYGSRVPVVRPAHITPTGVTFYGAFGQPFYLHGNAEELAGLTYAEDATGPVRVTCSRDAATAKPVRPVPASSVAQFDIESKINGQTYRLMMRVPVEPAPAGGYPVLYVLDGNDYFGTVSDEAQRMIAQRIVRPFVVVAVGYPTDDRGEQGGLRDYNLTLPVPVLVGRYGGVDAFLRVLDEEVKPFVAAHVPVAAADQALYGHSFGALAALHQLFRQPDRFACYVLSSPSIWWGGKEVLADETAFSQQVRDGTVHARVLITSAGDEQRADVPGGDREAGIHLMVDNASDLASRLAVLNPQAMPVARVVFPGEVHGSVPQASTSRAVRFCFPPR